MSQGPSTHRGLDSIVNPGQEQTLNAKFAYGLADADLADEDVYIWIETSCGDWVKKATVRTSAEGQISYTIPEADRLGAGSYRVMWEVAGDLSQARSWLHVWPTGTHVVVSDLDGTLTAEETEDWSTFDPASATPRPFAVETHAVYAAKGYRLINLNSRPDTLTAGTRAWFENQGFPSSILRLSETYSGVVGEAAATYKQAYLQALMQNQGVIVDWADGNTESDLNAYLGAGIEPARINLLEYAGAANGANVLTGYQSEPARVACLAPVVLP